MNGTKNCCPAQIEPQSHLLHGQARIFSNHGLELLQEVLIPLPNFESTLFPPLGSQRLAHRLFRLFGGLRKVLHGRFRELKEVYNFLGRATATEGHENRGAAIELRGHFCLFCFQSKAIKITTL